MDYLKNLMTEVENWLQSPLRTSIDHSLDFSEQLLSRLQTAMEEDSSSKKQLGGLIGRVKGMQKGLSNLEMANWVSIGHGHLAIGHRPSSKLLTDLKLQNTTHLLTLLSEGEGSNDIKTLAQRSNMGWLWFPMQSARFPDEERYHELVSLFKQMDDILQNGGKIYIHCSAGIHRTGMITFAFLRFIGLSRDEAKHKLAELRPTTSEGVGEDRMEWGNSVYQKLRDLS